MYQCFGFSVFHTVHGENLQLLLHEEQPVYTETGTVVFVAQGV